VISVPLVVRETVFGVLTLEGGSEPLGSHDIAMVERLGLIVSPILKLKHDVEIPVPRRLVSATAALAQKVLGPSYLVVKLMVLVLAVAAVFAASVDGQRRIVADANLEARDVHAVVAPARGYISKVHRRAGDAVEAGAPLAELDRRDLVVELEKWRTELSKNVEEQHAALASRDRRRSRVLKLQEQQIEAQIRLVENLMERGNLVSPVAGIVTSADPNFSYGAPVERGQLLFEIAPLTSYRLVLSVDEGDIADVAPGQGGRMVLSGRPFEPLQFTVRDVVPLAESGGGQNRFRVEADLEEAPEWLRPGMSGIAKISVGEERLAWLWTHRMLEAVQLTLWRWGWS
jgi:multidrug resistance efflux pump